MSQTPARDFIKSAIVDFRFYNGDIRNYANNANTLVTAGFVPTIQATHGVPALTYTPAHADQTWMLAAQDEVTIEALISADMYHLFPSDTEALSFKLLAGSWNVGLFQNPAAGFTSVSGLAFSFNGEVYPDTYHVQQAFSAATAISLHKGAPLHLIISARYSAGPLLEVATMINGIYDSVSVSGESHTMTAAPTNTLFDSTVIAPTYLLRMWDSYVADEQVFADLHREARKVLPAAPFVPVIANGIVFGGVD